MNNEQKLIFNAFKAFVKNIDSIPISKWGDYIGAVEGLRRCGAINASQKNELKKLINSKVVGE